MKYTVFSKYILVQDPYFQRDFCDSRAAVSNRHFCDDWNVPYPCFPKPKMVATHHKWLVNIWNVTSITEELNFNVI